MNSKLLHRGPDKSTTWSSRSCSIGFTRLSIIDLEGGMQPFFSEDGRVTSVINGEVYNHWELRSLLEDRKHVLRTHCDAEVIPHLYEEFGDSFPKYVNGMFAFAVWDGESVLLGRDRAGEKPLYYIEHNGILVFASEIKALIEYQGCEFSINDDYLYPHSYFDSGDWTFISEIRQLKPGHILKYKPENPESVQERFWDYPARYDMSDEEQILPEICSKFDDSIDLRLRADVPVGLLLSGGLDSALVLAAAADRLDDLHTFTVGAADGSERELATELAQIYGTTHHEISLDVASMAKLLPEVIWAVESCEPRTIDTAIPCYAVMGLAKEYVRVVLCGEGSDEIFAGYRNYFLALSDEQAIFDECLLHSSTLYNLNLRRVDGVSMAHSLEARCPFLDHRLIELAFRITPFLKTQGGIEKYILRAAMRGRLPDDYLNREKCNFNVGTGLVDEWSNWIDSTITDSSICKLRIKKVGKPKRSTWQVHRESTFEKYAILLCNLFYEKFVSKEDIGDVADLFS